MRPTVIVVAHTHWDREWHQPFEVFRLRLTNMVRELVDILDGDARFAHFMLDGQTVAIDDVLALAPSLEPRLRAHIAAGRIGVGPWYVLQDEFLVGAEAIVRNLSEGARGARRFGRPMAIGYLPDAFGHIAQMPRILRGFGIDTAVVWRGVGDGAPGSEWRWRAPSGAEVLCLFLPGGYGNAHDVASAHARLRDDLARSRAGVVLWMNGNDHQPAQRELPARLDAVRRAEPDVDVAQASLERAAALVRQRLDVAALPAVDGELRRASKTAPVLSGTWSSRAWQKRDHDRAQALLVRVVEPFVAFAGLERREAIAQVWRTLLQCQPHDSICGCSIDDVHRDVAARLRAVEQLGGALADEAVRALAGAPPGDFALHEAIAIANPHPFVAGAAAEVDVQRRIADGPFRLVGPTGETAYEIVARTPSDGPDGKPAEWLRLRVHARDLLPHGLRVLAIEPGAPTAPADDSPLRVRAVAGGIEISDGTSGLVVEHTFVDEGDGGDLYDFCPRADAPPRSSRDVDLGVTVRARAVGRRVDIEADVDNRAPDHRLRARFASSAPIDAFATDTAFGWIERREGGTHPVAMISAAPGFAVGGFGLHEVERSDDGALLLTLFRAVGWMSRGDLATRPGHAGYHVATPDAQGLGRQRFAYSIAFGADAARAVEPGIVPPRAVALSRARPIDLSLLSIEPSSVRLSIFKRADEGDAFILRLVGAPGAAVRARVRLHRPIRRAWISDLDERVGDPIEVRDPLEVLIAPDDIVTLRIELQG